MNGKDAKWNRGMLEEIESRTFHHLVHQT